MTHLCPLPPNFGATLREAADHTDMLKGFDGLALK
jgi:hypothetical protein